jgi:F-type H+-transporting ATPase subunit b
VTMHFDWSTLVLQTANFAVLVWLLHRFLYRPVLRMVDARRADIEQQYEGARTAEAQAKDRLTAVEAERAGIAAERTAALRETTAEAEQAASARRAQAEREAAALLEEARKTLAAERSQALADTKRAALDLGAEIAGRLLAEVPMKLRADGWIERVEQYLTALPKPELDALTQQLPDGVPIRVVTAALLPGESQETWCSRLHNILCPRTAIEFAVDPSLVAGAELYFPNAILRFSWKNALAAMRGEVEADANAR